jgi:hypothetical protein
MCSGKSFLRSFISWYTFWSKYSKTKWRDDLSKTTSYNYTMFGWLSFISDWISFWQMQASHL